MSLRELLTTSFQEVVQGVSSKTSIMSFGLSRFEAHMLDTLHRPFLFKIKVAEETYQDETRVKTSVMK